MNTTIDNKPNILNPKKLFRFIFPIVLTLMLSTCGGGRDENDITPSGVTPATLTSIAVTPVNPSIAKGTQLQFTVMCTFSDLSSNTTSTDITWASSAIDVATIDNTGLATAVSAGTTTITASRGDIKDSTVLTVTDATLSSITVTPINSSIAWLTSVPNTQQFFAAGLFSDSSMQDPLAPVTWSSSNEGVATVNTTTGLATPISAGSTTITAGFGNVSGSTTLTITIPYLQWGAPVKYSDGSDVLPGDLKAYNVYFSTQSGVYSNATGSYYSVSAPSTSVNVKDLNLTPATYYFVVTALDINDMESDFSNEVSAVIQ